MGHVTPIWKVALQLVPNKNRWSVLFHVSRSSQNSAQQSRARLGCASCRIPSWCKPQRPSQCCILPMPETRYRQHPAAYLRSCRHFWLPPFVVPSWLVLVLLLFGVFFVLVSRVFFFLPRFFLEDGKNNNNGNGFWKKSGSRGSTACPKKLKLRKYSQNETRAAKWLQWRQEVGRDADGGKVVPCKIDHYRLGNARGRGWMMNGIVDRKYYDIVLTVRTRIGKVGSRHTLST